MQRTNQTEKRGCLYERNKGCAHLKLVCGVELGERGVCEFKYPRFMAHVVRFVL